MNFDQADELIQLDTEQTKAFKALGRAYKKCINVGIYFHQVLESLQAFNGNNVECVNDTKEGGWLTQEMSPPDIKIVSAWADDNHYVHFKKSLEQK
jgi:hypothetical protein